MRNQRRVWGPVIALSGFLMLTFFSWPVGADSSGASEQTEEKIRLLWQDLQRLLESLPEARRAELWRELNEPVPQEPKAEPTAVEPIAESTPPGAPPPAEEPVPTESVPAPKPESTLEPEPTPAPGSEPTGTEPVVAEAPSTEAPPTQPVDSQPVPKKGSRGCNTLAPFDSDGDGKLTGLDRYWRFFYLWLDRNGDGRWDERELEPPYELGVRAIDGNLRSFVRGKKKRARELEILDESYLLLDLDGNGWSGLAPTGKDGALAVDFDALREVEGPAFLDAQGQAVEGIQPFRPGWSFRNESGDTVAARCPRP